MRDRHNVRPVIINFSFYVNARFGRRLLYAKYARIIFIYLFFVHLRYHCALLGFSGDMHILQAAIVSAENFNYLTFRLLKTRRRKVVSRGKSALLRSFVWQLPFNNRNELSLRLFET